MFLIISGARQVVAEILEKDNRLLKGKSENPSWKKGLAFAFTGITLFMASFIAMFVLMTPGPGIISTWRQTESHLKEQYGETFELTGLSVSAQASDSTTPYYELTYRSTQTNGVLNAYYTKENDIFVKFETP